VKKWKLLAYYLEDLRVPLVVRVPQVGNPWNKGTCLFRPGYLQTWAQLHGGHGEVSANKVHEFVKTSLRVYRNEKG